MTTIPIRKDLNARYAEKLSPVSVVYAYFTPGGGGHFRNFWVGMCHWDPGTLDLYQS